jgi:transcriptional regulator with XRE-family HTH domain
VPKTPRLREWRARAALSQEELSDHSGVSRATIADLEAGNRGAQPRTIRKLAEALGVEPEDLYGVPEAPKVEAPPSSEQPRLNGFEEERREPSYEVALEAARRQSEQDRQAAARAWESERPQTYFAHHENAAVVRLLTYPADELAGSVLELARRCIELEASRAVQLENFPVEQVAAFLAENERDNERIRRELEKLSANDIREMMLQSPPLRRLSEAYRNEAERRAGQQVQRRPAAG